MRELKDVRPPLLWEPRQGAETLRFVDRKHERAKIPKAALENVVFEAQQILGRCVNPQTLSGQRTGLVVGYVQSGKTLSFTTLAALAHDNGFALIVLIAGTLENLKQQTLERLTSDLELSAHGVIRPWLLVHQPSEKTSDATLLQQHLKNWTDSSYPLHKKRVCIVVVLKHPKRMANLRDCLKGLELAKIPTLVIDDEADQASLNTFAASNQLKGTNRASANYREVLALKEIFPHHTYVQYTATPQANLLISLVDHLSPEFAELVSPGAGYVGGATLFKPMSGYTKTIPDSEAAAKFSTSSGPPATLVDALRIYLLAACATEVKREGANRTMMVHPSQQTGPHNDYLLWLGELIDAWRSIVSANDNDVLKQEFFSGFRNAYQDLQCTTNGDLAEFDDLVSHLGVVLRTVMVREVNSTGPGSAPISWSASEYWILVGGAKLDRGFTVEGLIVTYMPRPLATGHADSLQQRARFYGYKERYLGYCRVYLQRDVRIAFEKYVEHEADIHHSLDSQRGYELKDWVRHFILDSSMKPTRKGVIGIPITEFLASGWIEPSGAHINARCVESNREIFSKFSQQLQTYPPGKPAQEVYPDIFIDKRSKSEPNLLYEAVPVDVVVRDLLGNLEMGLQSDELERCAAILALERLRDEGHKYMDVFLIANGLSLSRSKKANNVINQTSQGKSPAGKIDRSLLTYGGDRSFVALERVSLHLRYFTLLNADTKAVEESDVPWFAVHIPEGLEKNYLVQKDG